MGDTDWEPAPNSLQGCAAGMPLPLAFSLGQQLPDFHASYFGAQAKVFCCLQGWKRSLGSAACFALRMSWLLGLLRDFTLPALPCSQLTTAAQITINS